MKSTLALAILCICTQTHALSAADIVKKADKARAPRVPHSVIAKISNQGGEETSGVYKVYFKNVDVSLLEQLEPERQAGRKILMNDDNVWLITPNIKRPTRVSLEHRLSGQVANGDLIQTSYVEDYDAEVAGEKKLRGKDVYHLKLNANNKNVTYAKIDYYVEKKTFYPIESHFYAVSGKLLKTAAYGNFKKIFGSPMMTEISIKDAVQEKNKSKIQLSDFRKEKFSGSFFDKDALNQ